ncbi:MAG TPA: glutathione peroxidase [Xanthomonadales bacterium]|nr:glutathione peroxidase [Xanthomonadales bacterium]
MNIYEYTFRSIDDATMPLERWRGQPILLVNTASECGYTPQYEKLQRLYHEYHQSGLVLIGMPSNDFGGQEPGSEAEIKSFCTQKFDVTFPMTSKQTFNGPDAHPMFVAMVEEFTEDVLPRWNFCKYLFGKDGDLVETWPSEVAPDDSEFRRIIEQNLSAWRL